MKKNIVTARKKDESIQDVPMAVTAITEQLRESSVRRIEDIQAFAPNLLSIEHSSIASGAAITIRGIASLESDKSMSQQLVLLWTVCSWYIKWCSSR